MTDGSIFSLCTPQEASVAREGMSRTGRLRHESKKEQRHLLGFATLAVFPRHSFIMQSEREVRLHINWFATVYNNVSVINAPSDHHPHFWMYNLTLKNECSWFLISIPKCALYAIKAPENIFHSVRSNWATAETNCRDSNCLPQGLASPFSASILAPHLFCRLDR